MARAAAAARGVAVETGGDVRGSPLRLLAFGELLQPDVFVFATPPQLCRATHCVIAEESSV